MGTLEASIPSACSKGPDTLYADLAELSEAPTWLPLADEVLAGLETQYQRFLMHWKPQP